MKLVAISSVVVAILTTCSCQKQQAAEGPPPPTAVDVVEVQQRDIPIYGDWVATLQGYQNAQIQPQVSGYLIRQNYREGSIVRLQPANIEMDPILVPAAQVAIQGRVLGVLRKY